MCTAEHPFTDPEFKGTFNLSSFIHPGEFKISMEVEIDSGVPLLIPRSKTDSF